MKTVWLFLVLLTAVYAHASEETNNRDWQKLKEMYIGWDVMLAPIGNAARKESGIPGRIHTASQIAFIDTFTDWIKKSYVPIGGLAQTGKYVLPDCKEYCKNIPLSPGVSMMMWMPCYNNAGTKIIQAQPASHDDINIYINHLPGRENATWPDMNDTYLFTMYYTPKLEYLIEKQQQGIQPKIDEIRENIELDRNHFVYFTGGGSKVNVVLTPLEELPLVQLTKEEVLDEGLKAIEKANQNNQLMAWQYKAYTTEIEKLRRKHESSLDQPAFVRSAQLALHSFSTDPDTFDTSGFNYPFPVYRFDESVYTAAKKNRALWVTVSFPYSGPTHKNYINYTSEREIFNAMVHNFNYEYVYDYFFQPPNIDGKPYEVRNPEILQANVNHYQRIKK